MSVLWFRGMWLGAAVSVVALVIFYRSLSPALGVQQPTIISLGVLRLLAVRFLGGMGIGFVAVIAALIALYEVAGHYLKPH